ncbi:hypothetical protein DFJ77DRAFT_548064 [Powellomyces hirtus]|nr:hypothetical protein DFJ77DRAFT_548064 [Powellomyces hirtus]
MDASGNAAPHPVPSHRHASANAQQISLAKEAVHWRMTQFIWALSPDPMTSRDYSYWEEVSQKLFTPDARYILDFSPVASNMQYDLCMRAMARHLMTLYECGLIGSHMHLGEPVLEPRINPRMRGERIGQVNFPDSSYTMEYEGGTTIVYKGNVRATFTAIGKMELFQFTSTKMTEMKTCGQVPQSSTDETTKPEPAKLNSKIKLPILVVRRLQVSRGTQAAQIARHAAKDGPMAALHNIAKAVLRRWTIIDGHPGVANLPASLAADLPPIGYPPIGDAGIPIPTQTNIPNNPYMCAMQEPPPIAANADLAYGQNIEAPVPFGMNVTYVRPVAVTYVPMPFSATGPYSAFAQSIAVPQPLYPAVYQYPQQPQPTQMLPLEQKSGKRPPPIDTSLPPAKKASSPSPKQSAPHKPKPAGKPKKPAGKKNKEPKSG